MTTHELQRIWPEWEIIRPLGEGAFGKVYEIKRGEGRERDSIAPEEHAALKVIHIPQSESEVKYLRSEGADEASVSAHFRELAGQLSNEIATQARLKGNSNIVSYEDRKIVPDADGVGYTILIRMELLTSLLDHMTAHPMGLDDVLQLGLDMAKALLLCERHRIVHRDIKPQNIFISQSGDYKLGDFGVARQLEQTTNNLSRKGTYNYMAPEVFHGRPGNATVDIYSLGIVLYTLLNGNRAPFLQPPPAPFPNARDREAAQHRRLSGEALPPLTGVPDALNGAILKMCAFDPKDRYQNPRELTGALESAALVLQGEKTVSLRSWIGSNTPSVVPPSNDLTEDEGSRWIDGTPVVKAKAPEPEPIPEPPAPAPVPKKSISKTLVAVLACVVVVLVGVVAWLAMRDRPEPVDETDDITSAETTTTMPQLNYSVGDTVHFGEYDWRVLDVQNGKALLLSEDIIELRAYNISYTDVTWETCTLRAYLNGEFYRKFSEADRAHIALTRNENPDDTWGISHGKQYNTPGGNPTDDHIFLLSVPEVLKYYPGQKLFKDSGGDAVNYEADERLVAKFNNNESFWWLRSPGAYQYYAANVETDGGVNLLSMNVNYTSGGVRPALWVEAAAIAQPAAVTTTTKPTTTTQEPTTVTTTTAKSNYPTSLSGRYTPPPQTPGTVTLYDTYVFYENGTVSILSALGITLGHYTIHGNTVTIQAKALLQDVTLTFVISEDGNTLTAPRGTVHTKTK